MKPYSLAAYNSIGNGTVLDTLQSMPGLYLEQTNSATAHGGGIFGLLQTLTRYPALAAAVISLVALGCAAVFVRIDRKKRE